MSITPTLDLHNEQHFKFAENTDSSGFCCCWKSQSKPIEYYINKDYELEGRKKKLRYQQRIESNQRLGEIIKGKIQCNNIEDNDLFEKLSHRVSLSNGDALTDEKLSIVINELYTLIQEHKDEEKIRTK